MDAKVGIEQWRQHYNEVRPHSSLGYLTPAEFKAQPDQSRHVAERRHVRDGVAGEIEPTELVEPRQRPESAIRLSDRFSRSSPVSPASGPRSSIRLPARFSTRRPVSPASGLRSAIALWLRSSSRRPGEVSRINRRDGARRDLAGLDEVVEGGAGDVQYLGDRGLGDILAQQRPDVLLLAVEPGCSQGPLGPGRAVSPWLWQRRVLPWSVLRSGPPPMQPKLRGSDSYPGGSVPH